MQVANLGKTDLLARVAARGKALEQDATNPHRAIDMMENARDEVVLKNAGGNTIGEMRAVAKAATEIYSRQSVTAIAGTGLCGAAGLAAVLCLGQPALGFGMLVGGLGIAFVGGRLESHLPENRQLLATLDRWQAALEAEPANK